MNDKLFKTVAVITRTKDRPILLKRAKESICGQVFKDFIWVIINDGGNINGLSEIVEEAKSQGINVLFINNENSRGMEAASNLAIKSSDSKYIVIHDDDDSWESDFLETTVTFLESDKNKIFGGVVSRVNLIEEVLENNLCRKVKSYPFNEWLNHIYFRDLLSHNLFPPISFLFKRSIYDKTNGFDESLPVLGDWDFHMRFLMYANIAVIPKILANYHQRINTPQAVYCNTVVDGIALHHTYDMVIRNKYLRDDIQNNKNGLGMLMNARQALVLPKLEYEIKQLEDNIKDLKEALSTAKHHNTDLEFQRAQINDELELIKETISWRITKPLRAISSKYPSVSNTLYKTLKLLGCMFTFKLFKELKARYSFLRKKIMHRYLIMNFLTCHLWQIRLRMLV